MQVKNIEREENQYRRYQQRRNTINLWFGLDYVRCTMLIYKEYFEAANVE